MRMATGLLALLASAPVQAAELSIPHERYTLDNGLEVILAQDTSTPIVHVQLWYHVGSKDERTGLTGFAHLFEHLMFQGSANAAGEYFTPLQEVGADINGTTNVDRTNYFETLPSKYLPLALFMESDRMGNLLQVLDEDKLDNQREVVKNERRQRYENPPYGEAFSDLTAAIFPEGHPYHHSTIGSHVDLENASLDDVKAFFKTWYAPNNASLVVAGDFDTDTAKALVAENFGWIPKGNEPERLPLNSAPIPEDVLIEQIDEVPDQKVWIGYRSPALFADGDADLDVMSSLLCSGKDSRLYQVAVKERKVARDVGCYQVSRMLESSYVFSGTAAEGHDTSELVAIIDEVVAELLDAKPPTADEVTAAVASYEVGYLGRMATISGKAGALSSYLYTTGEADGMQADLDRYLKVTPESVSAAAKATLGSKRVQLHIRPGGDAAAEEEGQ